MGKAKRILITSYRYPPESSPRAFRTGELVKEFLKRGYEVDLFIPDVIDVNLEKEERSVHYHLIRTNRSTISSNKSKTDKLSFIGNIRRILSSSVRTLTRYVFGDFPSGVIYGIRLYKELKKYQLNTQVDLVISIGLSFYVHLATAKFIRKFKLQCIKVCDYGDPFYFNPAHKKLFALRYLEKWSMNQFDYISIPTEKSINYYTLFKDKSKIKVIPQGFEFSNISVEKYEKNDIPTFGYAGTFYKSIRDPEYLFEFLSSLEMDFRFIIYTKLDDQFFQSIFEKYKDKLEGKIIINDFIPREELIRQLSKMDFLVNQENDNSNQVPSKVIDYALSNRPILSVNKGTFEKKVFLDFIKGNYDKALEINIEDYNIKNVVTQFEALSETMN